MNEQTDVTLFTDTSKNFPGADENQCSNSAFTLSRGMTP